MFGKKKLEGVHLTHYSGLKGFSPDNPCSIQCSNGAVVFQKINPDLTVTLPVKKILDVSEYPEDQYMVKFHQVHGIPGKIHRFFYVFRYQGEAGEQELHFWTIAQNTFKVNKVIESIRAELSVTDYTL